MNQKGISLVSSFDAACLLPVKLQAKKFDVMARSERPFDTPKNRTITNRFLFTGIIHQIANIYRESFRLYQQYLTKNRK